jgi:ATP-dependent 26S proteasome regulatory subunit
MLNKREKNTSKKNIRSFTDINNYNNFLIELDNKNKKLNNINFKSCNFKPNPKESEKTNIKKFIKNVDYNFVNSNLENPNFTGLNIMDTLITAIESKLDPNMYENPNDELKKDKNYYVDCKVKSQINFLRESNIKKTKVDINVQVNNINDLISLIDTYPDAIDTEYNINISALHKIKEPLIQLNQMIGMKILKENIIDQILFYIQNLHSLDKCKGNDFMHTVIYGPPGTGKTEIAKIIGSIFAKLGILTKGTFKKVTRADLIAGYLGQTSLKTRDVIKECLGGVLFIDEAYALGNEEKRDSFSKECIDTLCEALSDHKDNLMVIVAGYEEELNNCFFNYNQGLTSRFTWRFKTEEYSGEELYKIFIKKVFDSGWFLDEKSKIQIEWFDKNKCYLKFYGRDIENLFAKTKIAHSRRVFCLEQSLKRVLTINDIEKGLELYLKNEQSKDKEKEKLNKLMSSMYV